LSFFDELKRRNVFRVATAYVVTSWLILQVADVVLNNFTAPDWVFHVLTLALVIGFLFALIVAWAFELTPQGLKRDSEVDHTQPYIAQSNRKLDFVIIGVLIVALSYFAYDKLVLSTEREAALVEATTQAIEGEIAAEAELESKAQKSVAVLPFVNRSQDPENDYFSDGISEELLNVLATYPELRVAARSSSFQFRGQDVNIEEVAEALHVNHVLEGSVRKSGDQVRITAQLIRTATGFNVWSETYDRKLVDIFAIQDEISAAIGGALKVQLNLEDGSGRASPTVRRAANVEAFEAYMEGRQLINMRGPKNLEQAIIQLEKALVLDKDYAPAHAQLATAIVMLGGEWRGYDDLTREQLVERVTLHIDRAIELDDRLPEAYAARTIMSYVLKDFDAVIENGTHALELNQNYADVVTWLYLAYAGKGQFSEATDILERFLPIDPLSIGGRINLAYPLALRGQLEPARKMANSIATQVPLYSYLSNAQISQHAAGDLADALKWLLMALPHIPGPRGLRVNDDTSEVLGNLDLLPEALRLLDDAHFRAYQGLRMWPELQAAAGNRLENNVSDPYSKVYFADALHLTGEIEQAQFMYEELLASLSGMPVVKPYYLTVEPTARAAFGRHYAGDTEGAAELVKLAVAWQDELGRAGWKGKDYYRAAAILSGVEGNQAVALFNIEDAIEAGLRDRSVFSEPALQQFRDAPEFLALEAKLVKILASERKKALQMLCFSNPVAEFWQPLPETCEGVTAAL
jgi:TolB-like protein